MTDENIEKAALRLRQVWQNGEYCAPVRDLIGLDNIDAAYAVQALNTEYWQGQGRQLVGRKIGATSQAIQEMMGVDFPDFGMLYADMQSMEASTVPVSSLHQPFVEAEIAVVLKEGLGRPNISLDDVAEAIDYVLPAIEIIGSRIKGWDLKMPDTISDNASSSRFVIGQTPVALDDIDIFGCAMTTLKNGEIVSQGSAEVCLGSPLFALIWLADEAFRRGCPLKAGELILTGAMGPIAPVVAGDDILVKIEGLDELSIRFGDG